MANQYDVLGKAPGLEELNKLSLNDVHLTIRGLNAGYGKMEILHKFDLTVSKAQSLCLIGPNGAGKSTVLKAELATFSFISFFNISLRKVTFFKFGKNLLLVLFLA